MNAPAVAEMFIHQQLAASTALVSAMGGIKAFPVQATQGTRPPYVILSQRSSNRTQAQGESEWMQTILIYNVKVVTQEGDTFQQADRIANLIFQALQDKEGTVTFEGRDYYATVVRQEDTDIRFVSNESDLRFNHVGAPYMIVVQPMP